jgi:hypothetical protein
MIDPKLNEIPVPDSKKRNVAAEDEIDKTSAKPRSGLSIKDTVAGDTMLSVGGRGVDTSGTRTGAGAGAGMTSVSTAPSGSPAPEIVPGARTSGTTATSDSIPGQTPTVRLENQTGTSTDTLNASNDLDASDLYEPTHHEISGRAYECWMERGCPDGSSEADWHRAESELRTRRPLTKTTASGM